MVDIIWKERKRIMGLPISFTVYSLSKDRLFTESGFLSSTEDQIELYMVRDIQLKRSFWQRFFGLGTIELITGDRSSPNLEIKNIPDSKNVKEMIYQLIVEAKKDKRVMYHENFGSSDNN